MPALDDVIPADAAAQAGLAGTTDQNTLDNDIIINKFD